MTATGSAEATEGTDEVGASEVGASQAGADETEPTESGASPTSSIASDASPSRSLFRNRDYVCWWIGETVSEFGSSLSQVAYPLLLLAATGSAAQAGIAGAAGGLGALATMLVGGVLADRWSRRLLLVVGSLVQAALVASVMLAVAAGHVLVGQIAAVGLLQGIVGGLTGGAGQPALRRVVPAGQLPAAFSQMHGRTQAVRLAGPPAGGGLFMLGRWVPFLADAASFLAGAVGVLLIRRPLGPDAADLVEDATPRESVLAGVRTGFGYVWRDAYLRFLTISTAVVNFAAGSLFFLVIVLVREHGGSPALVGAVSGASAAGGVAGAFLAPRIVRRVPGRLLVLALSWGMVVVFALIGVVPSVWAIGGLLAVLLVLVVPINVVFDTYETRMVPDELSGRVFSAIGFGAMSLRWCGPLVAGFLATAFTPTVATLAMAGVVLTNTVGTHVSRGLHVLDLPIEQVTAGTPVA